MKTHVYNHIAEMLIQYGVPYVFGMRVYPEMDTERIRPMTVHHETSAALMAYGYARVSGRPGVMTLNRAATPNVIMGLTEAWSSSVPVIVLQDGVSIASEGKNALYAQDQLGMLRPVTKWIADVPDLANAPEMLAKAFRAATTGRPRPVVVNLRGAGSIASPDQIVDAQPLFEPDYAAYPAQRLAPDPRMVEKAVDVLAKARRPCIVAGGGVNLSRAWDDLRELADLGGFPVATTISGKGAFPERHPLSAGPTGGVVGGRLGRGRVAEQVVKDSDVVLLLGSRTNEMATSRWTVPDPKSTIVHIDVDPEEIGRNYATAVGVVGDVKASLRALIDALGARGFTPPPSRTDEIATLLARWRADNAEIMSSDASPVHPARLLQEMQEFVGPQTILVSDGSSPFMWATSHTFVEAGPTFITPRGTGAIGTGLPMAIGAKLAAPDKTVICFEGDGGLMCGILAELEMAARYGVAVVVVVFNNGSFLLERHNMRDYPLNEEMRFLPGLNFANIAREFQCEGFRVERPDEIRPALDAAIRSGKPALVDVVCDPEVVFPSRA